MSNFKAYCHTGKSIKTDHPMHNFSFIYTVNFIKVHKHTGKV